jgi:hypothetical protein
VVSWKYVPGYERRFRSWLSRKGTACAVVVSVENYPDPL